MATSALPSTCLLRWLHRRGFGVQSPWAYEFVRDALFERHRYYAFDTLGGGPGEEQLFRAVLWLRPAKIMAAGLTDLERKYILAAQPKTTLLELDLGQIESDIFVIIGRIHRENSAFWAKILSHPQRTSAFDLGRRGMALFDPRRQRQIYYL